METLPFLSGKIFNPFGQLSSIIHHYEWFETEIDLKEIIVPLYPNFTSGFVFIFYEDQPILTRVKKLPETELNACCLLPPITHHIQNRRIKNLKVFRVIFQPGALYSLYGIPLNKIQNHILNPGDDLDSNLYTLHQQMMECSDLMNCIQLFEKYLIKHLERVKQSFSDKFPLIIQALYKLGPGTRVEALAAYLGVDRTTLAKWVKQYLGFKTIQLLSIYRFCSAIQCIHRIPNLSLAQLALDLGYNDQAYFSNEFRRMSGYSPGKYKRLLYLKEARKIFNVEYSGLLVKIL